MLTRIEIDGFKSFEGFALDISPFAVVLGSNASGKSNLFDAIQLLSRLADVDLRTAFKGLRGGSENLFRQASPAKPVTRMTLAAEVLLSPVVNDPWQQRVELAHTRLRYKLTVERTTADNGVPRLVVVDERAEPILAKDDGNWRPHGRDLDEGFRQRHLRYSRRVPFLETEDEGGKRSFNIRQDGRAGLARPGHAAEATVLSSITTAEFPHLYALRQELRSWRLLQLDPTALRKPSQLTDDTELLPDGSNLAAVLYRIESETRDKTHPRGALAGISSALAEVIPGVLDVGVSRDDAAREYRARVELNDGFRFPTSVISDGTLRVLALLTLLHDPEHRGLVCFEEPENGVHPARLEMLLEHLQSLVTDPSLHSDGEDASAHDGGDGNDSSEESVPLSQLLMNSHSPVVLSAVRSKPASQVLLADLVTVADPDSGQSRRKTRIRPVLGNGQGSLFDGIDERVSRFEVQRILQTVNEDA